MMLKSSLLASLVTISFVSAAYVPFGARSLGGLKRRQGTQFITGPCASDSECALGCCAFNTGKCAAALVAITRDNGCGFGEAQSNVNAAIAQGFGNNADVINFVPTQRGGGAAPPPAAPPAPPVNNGGSAPAAGSTGTQFITGPCSKDSDCALGCCGFNTGKCAGAVVALTRDGGCGFGDAQSNANAAIAQGFGNNADVINFKPTQRAAKRATPPPAARSLKRRQGTQFITGPCASDNDCALGCCAFNTGKCAGAVVALTRDGGCGFGDAQSNANAAIAQGFGNNADVINFVPTQRAGGAAPPAAPPAAPANNGGAAPAAGSTGTQFITGPCSKDSDCALGCCGFNSGKCAGAVIALSRDGGCGFGDAQSNANAAIAQGFGGQADVINFKPTRRA
ncbi:hypothetical protein BDV98DRAFT_574136 [Pterulicium gracile]|uniref:Biotrophy-associated secreted protein 2 n=1 Tax=Pterulicium gracile TaxID=1884261 RepID=A0A5C3Q9L3_9AGAR|nr:hypothetical protein BDV98DRAFT_574136 [Pterula gracilis]